MDPVGRCRPGSVREVESILDAERAYGIALFVGGRSYAACGAATVLEPMLEGRIAVRLDGLPRLPELEAIGRAAESLLGSGVDAVVAVGGGSVLDIAKAARGLAHEPDRRAAVSSGPHGAGLSIPLVAVPTTAGTGSEATHFSVVYVDGVKHSVGHPSFRPEHVVLDPDLTASMSSRLTAETGLDALSQAMESMWSTRSTPESLDDARRALRLAWTNLEAAVLAPTSDGRAAMCLAAHLSGRAIDISRTTAAHALSYHLTARHGIPHGHAVAVTLGPLLEFNASVTEGDCVDHRGAAFVRERVGEILTILGAEDAAGGRAAVTSLLDRIGLETSLSSLGIASAEGREAIVASVDADRLANNPRALARDDVASIVDGIA